MPATLIPAVQTFLTHAGGRAPDFSACLVLVPHPHAGVAFRRALAEVLPGRHLLPPRCATLAELAEQAAADIRPEPDSLRLAQLRDFLDSLGQVRRTALWDAARELLGLLDELDAADAGETALARLPDLANQHLTLEAEIVRQVWRALRAGGAPGRARVRVLGMRWLAQRAGHPLYVLGRLPDRGEERACLEEWRRRAGLVELPAPPADADCAALLEAAWDWREPPLAERAHDFAARHPQSPLSPHKTLLAAPGLEAAARAAEGLVLGWLAAGLRDIALVAVDRLMARRLRALLERHGILTQDETGWAFATASASHLPEAWLRLLTGDAWFRDLLDLLKSPYVFADAVDLRERAIAELDAAFRRHGAPDGLNGHLDLARREGLHAALSLLRRVEAAVRAFGQGRHTLGAWTQRLLRALRALAAEDALRADPVGQQLWGLLETLASEGAAHGTRYALADWRRWLFHHLEQSTFQDGTVASPVRLTHLAAAHTRDWQGAIILGAGAAQLPGAPSATLFNDATRLQLGLPAAAERERELRVALGDVLARVPRVALVWQSERDGDPAPLSPWLAHLDAFHRAAWGEAWLAPLVAPPPAAVPAGAGEVAPPPAPGAPAVPERMSVSAWQSLVACPYQFFARHVLGLNELDEVPDEMDKADYGSLVHAILARFHGARPSLAGCHADMLAAELRALGREVFAAAEARGYLASVWRARWERHVDDYIAWALDREARGYVFRAAERVLQRPLEWGGERPTLLYGRTDRWDEREGVGALLDYKTQSRETLRGKLAGAGEDVQLTAYAWLAEAGEAGFVSIDAERVETLAWGGNLAADANAEADRLRATLADLAAGLPLAAQGARATCAWCEMRGLCRHEHRPPPEA